MLEYYTDLPFKPIHIAGLTAQINANNILYRLVWIRKKYHAYVVHLQGNEQSLSYFNNPTRGFPHYQDAKAELK